MKVAPKPRHKAICNLCFMKFRRTSIYTRYCEVCRRESEIYRFADIWVTA